MSDKAKKAHHETVDISNGALFLRIADLERQVKYLTTRADKADDALGSVQRTVAFHDRSIDFKVGGCE